MTIEPKQNTKVSITFKSKEGNRECPYIVPSRKECNLFSRKCKHFSDYVSIHTDLIKASELLIKYESNDDSIIKEALWRQAIIHLGRIYTIGDERNINLQKKQYKSLLSASLNKTLDLVLNLRHNYIAHQGQNDEEYYDTFIILNHDSDKKILGLECTKYQTIALADNDISLFKKLLNELIIIIEAKLEELKSEILNDFSKLDIEKIYLEAKKPKNGSS